MAELPTEHETHVLKDPACLKQTPKRFFDSSRHNDIISPSDHEYRKHAGEIRLRNDRKVRAEPPPPPPTQARTTNSAKPNRGRKKQTGGFGDGDDSDSDYDSSQRNIGERDEGVTMRKKKQRSLAPDGELRAKSRSHLAGPSTSMSLTPEEEKRVQLQRQIARQRETDIGGWRRLLQDRQVYRDSALLDKGHMLNMFQTNPDIQRYLFDGSEAMIQKRWPNMHVLHLQEMRMRDYLDEALCHGITDADAMGDENCLSEKLSRLELVERTIKQAEKKLIVWWEQLVTPNEPTVQRVVAVLQTQQEDLLYDTMDEIHRHREEGLQLDPFTSWYEQRIFYQLGLPSQLSPESLFPLLVRGMDDDNLKDLNRMLSESRQKTNLGARLSREYIDWVCADAPPDLIDSCCEQTLQQVQGNKIREMLGPNSITQEFRKDDYNGTLSLVLLKGGMLVSIKTVSKLDQRLLGWYCEGGELYRYEIDEQLGYAFKIDVEGKLLGLWTPKGDMNISQIESLGHRLAVGRASNQQYE
ncbi:hypothetical protein F5B18DRAFT_562687 [Nemania serpens]|nr:hypothetical protein F5B18DRAFT_562687 [Nemania serpens]